MRTTMHGLIIVFLIGHACAQTFSSVEDAVINLPDLSILNSQVSTMSLASNLKDPSFVGTVFAPINAGLNVLKDAVGGDLSTVLGNADQVNDVFSTSIIPGKALTLDQLTDGMQLTTLNGKTVTVTITNVNGGKAYYVNKARITTANIPAGKAIIQEVSTLVLQPDIQEMVDAIAPPDTSSAAPTAIWSSTSASSSTASTTSATTPTTTTTSPPTDDAVVTESADTSTSAYKKNAASTVAAGAAVLAVPMLVATLL